MLVIGHKSLELRQAFYPDVDPRFSRKKIPLAAEIVRIPDLSMDINEHKISAAAEYEPDANRVVFAAVKTSIIRVMSKTARVYRRHAACELKLFHRVRIKPHGNVKPVHHDAASIR